MLLSQLEMGKQRDKGASMFYFKHWVPASHKEILLKIMEHNLDRQGVCQFQECHPGRW